MILFLVPVLALGELTTGQGKKLDDILAKTGKMRQEGVKGFFPQQKSVAPETKVDTNKCLRPIFIAPYGQYVPYQSYVEDMTNLNNKINALQVEYASSSAKMTMILDNMAENAGAQKTP